MLLNSVDIYVCIVDGVLCDYFSFVSVCFGLFSVCVFIVMKFVVFALYCLCLFLCYLLFWFDCVGYASFTVWLDVFCAGCLCWVGLTAMVLRCGFTVCCLYASCLLDSLFVVGVVFCLLFRIVVCFVLLVFAICYCWCFDVMLVWLVVCLFGFGLDC